MGYKRILFRGLCTALATPFRDGRIDWDTLADLINYQIDQRVDALLVCGTTGEAATLSPKERKELVLRAGELIDGRVPYLVGVGTNSTDTTLAWACHAAACGADGLLVVSPYYNKGTEEGVVQHHLRIAEKVSLPQLIYHVPSRTGVRLSMSQLAEIAAHPSVVGIKEADPDLDRMADEIGTLGDRLSVYSGNDSLTIPCLSIGGLGLISVISNILPYEMGEIIRLFWAGRAEESRALFYRLLPLMRLLFARTNPAPLKCAMSLCGFGTGELRLPLAPVPTYIRTAIGEALSVL